MEACYVGLWNVVITVTSIDAMLWDVLPSKYPPTPVSEEPQAELTAASDSFCTDRHGNLVTDGAVFIPGDDACRKCHCAQGAAAMCTLVHCSAPPCVLWEPIPDECCQFHCIETSLGSPYDPNDSVLRNKNLTMIPISKEVDAASLGIRLAASAVSSLLIVVLLLFMVQRLRQRRLLITMRRLYNENRSSNDFIGYATSVDQTDSGFDFPSHEEPPPPYSLVNKPCEDEPPPSYDQINDEVPIETVVASGQGEVAPSSSSEDQGPVAHETNQYPEIVLGTARKQQVTEFCLVDGFNDSNLSGTESIELRNMQSVTVTSTSRTPSNAGKSCKGPPARMRPFRKKCRKCWYSADVNVVRGGHQVTRPRSLQVAELTEVRADFFNAILSKPKCRKSADNSSGYTVHDEEISDEQQFIKRQVCSNPTNCVGHRGVSAVLQDESAADGHTGDAMLCSAQAEASGESGIDKQEFQINAEHREVYRPVSCDMADFDQRQIVLDSCQLHSRDRKSDNNWILKSCGDQLCNLPETGRMSSVLKHVRPRAVAAVESKHESRRQSYADDGDLFTAIASTSNESANYAVPRRISHCVCE